MRGVFIHKRKKGLRLLTQPRVPNCKSKVNPTASTESLFDSIPLSKQEADKAAYQECTHNQLKQLFQMTKESKRCKKMDFEEAVTDFSERKYKSCAHLLVSLIEAKLIRMQKPSEQGIRGRAVGEKAVKKAKEKVNNSSGEDLLLTLLHMTNLFACMEKVFENGKDFRTQPLVINRNFLDHGMLTRRVTRRDCIQLFLLYYNTLEMLDYIYR